MMREKISRAIDREEAEIVALSRYIFDHPELGNQEFLAADRMTAYLSGKGFAVERGIAGLPTAFKAVAPHGRAGGPVIAFLAEYDALPEIGHACGHNVVAAAAVGAAIGLAAALKDQPGAVWVLGTPSEERSPQGKVVMADAGVFDGVDVALIIHGSDRTTTGGGSLAIQSVEMVFHGKPAHAAKYPWAGISALDAAMLAAHAIELHREHVPPDVRIHGIITDGGAAPNIVPERAAMRYYVRSTRSATVKEVLRKLENCVRGAGTAMGAGVEFKPGTMLDAKLLLPMLDRLLLEEAGAAGAARVRQAEEEMGSTDFGNVTRRIPAATLKVEITADRVGVHTREFAAASGATAGDRAAIIGAIAMAMTGWRLMSEAATLAAVKAEFKELSATV
jgi:amidohydrolase